MSRRREERITLTAAFLDGLALAVFAVGGLAPMPARDQCGGDRRRPAGLLDWSAIDLAPPALNPPLRRIRPPSAW